MWTSSFLLYEHEQNIIKKNRIRQQIVNREKQKLLDWDLMVYPIPLPPPRNPREPIKEFEKDSFIYKFFKYHNKPVWFY